MTIASPPSGGSLSVASRLKRAVPLGLGLGAIVWIVAAWGVHAYDDPTLQWLLIFPAVAFGPVAILAHAIQWVGYAYLYFSIRSHPGRRSYVVMLAGALILHFVVGLVTAPVH